MTDTFEEHGDKANGVKPIYRLKCVVIGDLGVGKTTLVRSFAEGPRTRSITAEPKSMWQKEIKMASYIVSLSIWDTAGNKLSSLPENFDHLRNLKDLRLHNNPLRTPPMDVCVSGVVQPIGRFIRRALEREGICLSLSSIISSKPVFEQNNFMIKRTCMYSLLLKSNPS